MEKNKNRDTAQELYEELCKVFEENGLEKPKLETKTGSVVIIRHKTNKKDN